MLPVCASTTPSPAACVPPPCARAFVMLSSAVPSCPLATLGVRVSDALHSTVALSPADESDHLFFRDPTYCASMRLCPSRQSPAGQ